LYVLALNGSGSEANELYLSHSSKIYELLSIGRAFTMKFSTLTIEKFYSIVTSSFSAYLFFFYFYSNGFVKSFILRLLEFYGGLPL
jgi:hypothetical protein